MGAGIGAVLAVDGQEFMRVAGGCWARADAPWVLVSDEELYVYALVNGVDLPCVQSPLSAELFAVRDGVRLALHCDMMVLAQ